MERQFVNSRNSVASAGLELLGNQLSSQQRRSLHGQLGAADFLAVERFVLNHLNFEPTGFDEDGNLQGWLSLDES